jgi:hypothetical protein
VRRFSIRDLMGFIVVSAIGLAALRNANELWAGGLLLLVLAAVGVAVMGAVILRGKERYWWAGFAFFAACYLVLAIGPWLNSWYASRIGTTHLLNQLRHRMFASDVEALSDSEAESLLQEVQLLEAQQAQARRVARNRNDAAIVSLTKRLQATRVKLTANQNAGPRREEFQEMGHSLFALLAGLVGGTVAVWFYVRRERGGIDAESSPHPVPQRALDAGDGGG